MSCDHESLTLLKLGLWKCPVKESKIYELSFLLILFTDLMQLLLTFVERRLG